MHRQNTQSAAFYEVHAPRGVYNTPCNDGDEKPLMADELDDPVANESDDLTSCNSDGESTKRSPNSLNTSIQDKEGNAALHFAPRIGNEGMFFTLLEPEATDINLQNKRGESPLHIAVTANRYEAAKCLLEESCSPCRIHYIWRTALLVGNCCAAERPSISQIGHEGEYAERLSRFLYL